MDAAKIVLASEDSLQIQFEQKICPEVNGQISAFVKEFASLTKDMPEVIEIVPTYCAASSEANFCRAASSKCLRWAGRL